jgi:hypothetical protein
MLVGYLGTCIYVSYHFPQIMLPEAIAIVMAPTDNTRYVMIIKILRTLPCISSLLSRNSINYQKSCMSCITCNRQFGCHLSLPDTSFVSTLYCHCRPLLAVPSSAQICAQMTNDNYVLIFSWNNALTILNLFVQNFWYLPPCWSWWCASNSRVSKAWFSSSWRSSRWGPNIRALQSCLYEPKTAVWYHRSTSTVVVSISEFM